MNRRRSPASRRVRGGFTLLEMIGVMAIIAILASILVPNVFRTLERALIKAETANLDALGEQVKIHLRARGQLPGAGATGWWDDLARYADLSPPDVRYNRRQAERLFVSDRSSTPARRVLLVSNLHSRLTLPSLAALEADFNTLWNTPEGRLPSPAMWNAWRAVTDSEEFLLIERINLEPLYQTELRSYTVTLNNLGSTPVSYRRYRTDGTAIGPVVISAAGSSGGTGGTGGSSGGSTGGTSGGSNWWDLLNQWWSNWGNWGSSGSGGSGSGSGTTETTGGSGTVTTAGGAVISDLRPGERLALCTDAAGQVVGFHYVISSMHRTFVFDGTTWTSQ